MIMAFTIMMKARLSIGVIGNLIDTIATLILYYNYGYTEANPIMAKLVELPFLFVVTKVTVINLLAVWLWKNRNDTHAKVLSWVLAIVYGAIAIYYAIFFVIM